MQKALHSIASIDTPATVEIPSSWAGLAMWAVGRFGGILVATAFLAYAWNDSNETHKKQTERLILMLEARASSDVALASALKDVSVVLGELKAEAKAAHHKQP